MKYKIVILFLLSATMFGLNLSITDLDDPIANHILDAEVVGDVLIVSAMVQGIEFYDISNPETLNHFTNFTLSQGGMGGGVNSNCVRASDGMAYFTSSNGIYKVNISNPSSPQNLGNIPNTSNLILENLDIEDNTMAVCAHTDGVLLFDISNPSSPIRITTIETGNAWAVALKNQIAYIADSQNILIVDVTNLEEPLTLGSILTSNSIKDVAESDGFLYVALGSDGVDIYSLEDPNSPQFLDNYNTTTLAHRISPFGNKIAVADWDDIEVLEWNGEALNQVGFKNTTKRTMGIATKEGFIYSAEWASVHILEFGEVSGPDLDLSTSELNYNYTNPGETSSLSLEVFNNGHETLIINDNYTTDPQFVIINPLTQLLPGESQIVEIVYNASNTNASGSYRIYSNDPDELEIICETNGNIDGANVGQPAPDFTLEYVANGSGSFTLSEHLSQIIVLAFFSPQ